MRVQLRVQISGTRDGADWPPPGSVVDLPDDEALGLISWGSALAVSDERVETATAPTSTRSPRTKS